MSATSDRSLLKICISVPSPPRSLIDRVKFLEDHIIHVEKQFPPWAALHFNQPNRGVSNFLHTWNTSHNIILQWPPPPRLTPIIVPSHLTSTTSQPEKAAVVSDAESEDMKAKAKAKARNKSSLHRAVMERLEVQKAMNDLAGVKTEENEGHS